MKKRNKKLRIKIEAIAELEVRDLVNLEDYLDKFREIGEAEIVDAELIPAK